MGEDERKRIEKLEGEGGMKEKEMKGITHKQCRRLGSLIILSSASVLFQNYDKWVPYVLQTWLLQCSVLEEGKKDGLEGGDELGEDRVEGQKGAKELEGS